MILGKCGNEMRASFACYVPRKITESSRIGEYAFR